MKCSTFTHRPQPDFSSISQLNANSEKHQKVFHCRVVSAKPVVLCDEEVEQALLDIIAERLGVEGPKVHVGGLDQMHWSKAGKATVLVHLPGAGIPPLTVSVIEAGGGVVLG